MQDRQPKLRIVREARVVRFGSFEADLSTGELRKKGTRVKLQNQPFQILSMLLELQGRVVTRDEIQRKLWPTDTFVDFDNGLNAAIRRLREALGDTAEKPRFIETLPRRGYRFIAPARFVDPAREPLAPAEPRQPEGVAASSTPRWRRLSAWAVAALATAVILVFVGVVIAAYRLARPLPPPSVSAYRPLTHDGRDKDILLPLLTDGLRIYFTEQTDNGETLASVSTAGGEVAPIPLPFSDFAVEGLSHDGRQLLVRNEDRLFRIPLPLGPPQEWPELLSVGTASWSPDGKMLVFSRGGTLYRALADEEPQKVANVPADIHWPRVSPDGKIVRFTVRSTAEDDHLSLWEVRADGGRLRPMFKGQPEQQCCGNWTPDGKYFFFVARRDLLGDRGQVWVMREASLWGRVVHEPVQLTHSSQDFFSPVASPDGKQIFAIAEEKRGELMNYDFGLRKFVQYLEGMSALWVSFSGDGQRIAYEKFPEATLWVANNDGSGARQLTFDPMEVDGLSLAPDGKQIAFRGREPGKPFKIHFISVDGAESQGHEPMPDHDKEEGIPTWSPDGSQVVFGDVPKPFGNDDGTHIIQIFHLKTHSVSPVPGSKGLWSARWSPDGHYLAALTISIPQKLHIFEFKSETRRDMRAGPIDNLTWSHDSRYVYYDTPGSVTVNSGIFRVRVSDAKREEVKLFGNLRRAAPWWSGLTPNDEPLILRDIGTSEIYALDVDWP